LMEINSGVSHYIVSLIQGFALLFIAAPAILRTIFRFRRRQDKNKAQASLPQAGG
jgi:ABC-type uncharacterized transport system permease subunit